jgi:ubiquitin-conjugating enzyme E2 C
MDYSMEDTQNAAPQAREASKLGAPAPRNDTQSVTKRLVADPQKKIYTSN